MKGKKQQQKENEKNELWDEYKHSNLISKKKNKIEK